MLMYCMGDKADNILYSFKYTEKETETYDIVKRKLGENIVPQRNSIFERALFNSRRQEPGELVEEFITALYTHIEHWKYRVLCDYMIRDRITVVIVMLNCQKSYS